MAENKQDQSEAEEFQRFLDGQDETIRKALTDMGAARLEHLTLVTEKDLVERGVRTLPARDFLKRYGSAQPARVSATAPSSSHSELPPLYMAAVHDSNEGLAGKLYYSERKQTIDQLLALEAPAIQVCAPPFSGKTSLRQLLFHVLSSGRGHTVYDLSMLEAGVNESFAALFSRRFGDWESFRLSSSPRFLLVDEAQLLYDGNDEFWGAVKLLSQGGIRNLRMFLFCSYGGERSAIFKATPFLFPPHWRILLNPQTINRNGVDTSQPGLAFPLVELQEYVAMIRSKRGWPFTDAVCRYVFHITGGHPGLCDLVLAFLGESTPPDLTELSNLMPPDTREAKASALYMKLLQSRELIARLLLSRSYATVSEMSEREKSICEQVLMGDECDETEFKDRLPECTRLVKMGFLQSHSGRISFSSRLFCRSFVTQLHSGPVVFDLDRFESLSRFIVEAVRRMRPSVLHNSHSVGSTGKLFERAFQMEFYRVAVSMLPRQYFVSPDVGKYFLHDCYLDFFINSQLGWGVELLRDGVELDEHVLRFLPGGIYKPMIDSGDLKEWAVLDMRSNRTERPNNLPPNIRCTIVSFSPDFSRAHVCQPLTSFADEVVVVGDHVLLE